MIKYAGSHDIYQIKHGSEEYRKTVDLRHEILREPLGLKFNQKNLAGEKDSFHLGCFVDGKLVACLVLKPISTLSVRLRQMAVHKEFRKQRIGQGLLKFAETFASDHGFKEIILHARETAVRFYQKSGYEVTGEQFIEVTIPHYPMRKILNCID